MNKARLAEIRARCEAATKGPWEWQRWPCESMEQALDWLKKSIEKGEGFKLQCVGAKDPDDVVICITGNGPRSEAHANMITASRQDIPDLLQALDERDAKIQRMREALAACQYSIISPNGPLYGVDGKLIDMLENALSDNGEGE